MSALPPDYDSDPARGRLDCVGRYGLAGDVHDPVADRLVAEGREPVLDLGCGRGRFAEALAGRLGWVGLDPSPAQLTDCPHRPVVLGSGTRLPFADASFGAVVSLWVLYHLPDPVAAIAEARRVLGPGGVFVSCTTSRFDSPELVDECPATTFDAEDAPGLVAEVFGDVEVETWDGPFTCLPDQAAVEEYARGHVLPAVKPVDTPLFVTKRGCVVWAVATERGRI